MFGLALRNKTVQTDGELDLQTPIAEVRYVVVDTELTGLDVKKDSIVSVGAVAMEGGRILLGKTFYEVVSPTTALRSESVVVHGIMPSEVAGKPSLSAVIEDFLRFCDGAVVVGHFLALDLGFLNKELRRLSNRTIGRPVVDTLQVHEWIRGHDMEFSRHYRGMAHNLDLYTMAAKYHIPVSGAHNALMDAFVTAQLFQRFQSVLPGLGVRTVKDLLKIGKP